MPHTSTNFTIGVLDSGWDRRIKDPRVLSGVAFTASDDSMRLLESSDDNDVIGHGTACTDLVLQVAPQARIVPIRIFGKRLETSLDVVLAALDWTVARDIPLLNLSFGTRHPSHILPLYRACERLRRLGKVIVSASDQGVVDAPAMFESVIGVRSIETSDKHTIIVRPMPDTEFGARGDGQIARTLGGHPGRVFGASMAAPIVTGHLATLLERHSAVNVDAARAWLERLAAVQQDHSYRHRSTQ